MRHFVLSRCEPELTKLLCKQRFYRSEGFVGMFLRVSRDAVLPREHLQTRLYRHGCEDFLGTCSSHQVLHHAHGTLFESEHHG